MNTTTECTAEIEQLIGSLESTNSESGVIQDGIIDPKLYFLAKFKILWILKEAYDPEYKDGRGGWWDFREVIRNKNTINDFSGAVNMYKNIIYVSWGILNNFENWANINDVKDDPSMLSAIKSVAYININKFPGSTSSDPQKIKGYYEKYKHILLKQIECYNPDIIIGGNTLQHFYSDLGNPITINNNSVNYFVLSNRLYIDAYHPTLRGIPNYLVDESDAWDKAEMYYNDIIKSVKDFLSSQTK
jgi:hypothetical protein